jgi:thiol-disulfide isomerase/thioredoxin
MPFQKSNIQRGLWFFLASLALLGAGLTLFYGGLPSHADYSGQEYADYGYAAPVVGALAPPFTAVRLNGESLQLETLRSKTIVLNFWATWCVPCQIEMPVLMAIAETYPDVIVLAVNTGEDPVIIRRWLNDYDIELPIVLDDNGMIARRYQLRGQPTTFIIGQDGIIQHVFIGMVTAPQLHQALASQP